ncbi:MAG: rhomboid family intramembrane serine protease [Nanoarchaeota archaeon]|nr:rhomboid family intramembrane serine protease [Nanoarchaeota archaeon]
MIGKIFKWLFRTYTNKLILANVIIFILFLILSAIFGQENIIPLVAMQPAAFFAGQNLWTLVTSMFMHAGFAHLFFNMFSLMFIGNFVEKLIGKRRFLIFYLISGIFAGLVFVLSAGLFGGSILGGKIFGMPLNYGVGASGAIFGLVGLLAVLTPRNHVYLILGPLIAIVLQAILENFITNASLMSIISLIINIYFIFSVFAIISFNSRIQKYSVPVNMPFWMLPIIAIVPLIIIGLFVTLPIGNMAHIGGLIAGLIYGFYLKYKYPKKTSMISRHFSK